MDKLRNLHVQVSPPDEAGEMQIVIRTTATEDELNEIIAVYDLKKEWIDDATDSRAMADVMGHRFYIGRL